MAERRSRRGRAALVYNPIKVDKRALRAAVSGRSSRAGWARPLFFETTIEDLGQKATRQALDQAVDAVLVAGGDGTVRAVAEALTGTGVPLTIVPSGTGTLLARNLGLPLLEPEHMIDATFTGDTIAIDVGIATLTRVDGEHEEYAFVVMGGIGLDAAMIANTRPKLKKTVGWVAYIDGAARSLPNAKPFRVVYQLEGRRMHTAKVQSVLFANCGALPAGISLVPDASITDGRLDVAVIQPAGWFGWLGVWRKVWWDNSVLRRFRAGRRVLQYRGRAASVRYRHGSSIEVAAEWPSAVQLDGDEFGKATRVRCRLEPGGLRVTVPHGHDTSRL
ncbi:MAG: diacylglycerol/lipid kinase family protein [Microbacterium sp.]|uniref:diacylglycerol/lipid kinase family protein n=1 Tax=Microbacterium sp. TaxID=51671 RepID=UPI003A88C328